MASAVHLTLKTIGSETELYPSVQIMESEGDWNYNFVHSHWYASYFSYGIEIISLWIHIFMSPFAVIGLVGMVHDNLEFSLIHVGGFYLEPNKKWKIIYSKSWRISVVLL